MTDARQLFAYTFYGLAVAILVVEQVTAIRTIRVLRKKYPDIRRPRWYTWAAPGAKEAQLDPDYRRLQRMHWVYLVVFASCILAAEYTLRLSGTTAPTWIRWLHP